MGQSRRRGAAGFTMLEALVAIVVLAFGVLGVANLLIKSFRFAQQSSYDVVALQLANDMADRMRASVDEANKNNYLFDTKTGTPNIADSGNLFRTACTGASAACAPLTANFDKADWARRVQTSLPNGRAVICRDSTTFQLNTGYQWGCTQTAGGNGSPSDTPIVIKVGWTSRFTDRAGADLATGTTMADSAAANGDATPMVVVVVNPGVNN
ncbi:type IV pilus modification protein PilV [Cupriavidus sp. KB_39]|jgi:type IV pilus assembly protein PilV|uniref:type IV pilus modification protein PilV n=1 Tax=Cupriavidus sp. KB_39 TaxID=3233036 RepID=UPI003F92DFE2